ncbi:MAG: DUF4340 domain-containing protein [Bacteroidetes bacterium]|nr:MAG: DUF4340 domain-containing protein [Bacteroidota bacterium]
MKTKNTIILALLLAALGAYVYFYEIKGGEARKKAEELASKVFVVEKDSIKSVLIKPKNIHFKKEKDHWQIIEPVEYDADKWNVDNLVRSIANAKKERIIADSTEDYTVYGFTDSSLQIIFSYDEKIDTLLLGDKNPTGTYVFARRSDSPQVFLTNTTLFYNANKSLFDFRDKSIVKFDYDEVNKIILTKGKTTFVGVKRDNKWYMEKPVEDEGDQATWNSILNYLKNRKIKEFVDEHPTNLAKYGLKYPAMRIDLFVGENNAKKTVLFGKRHKDKYYVKDESRNPVVLVDSTVYNKIYSLKTFDLRNKKVNDFTRSEVDYLEFAYPETRIICQKDSTDKWQIIEPETRKARDWKVSRIFDTLVDMKAVGMVDKQPASSDKFGFEKPRGEVIGKVGDKVVIDLLIGKEIKDKAYVKNILKNKIYLVQKPEANKLILRLSDLAEPVETQESKTGTNE